MGYWEKSGQTDEWYTPQCVFDALGCHFDLDVAGATRANVPASGAIFSDSLNSQWSGFVWMNPPYGGRNSLGPWLDKFIAHGNGIALVPDRTSAPWFQDAFSSMDAVLFTRKLKFVRPDGTTGNSPSNGSALMAIGHHGVGALHRAAGVGFGILAVPQRVRNAA